MTVPAVDEIEITIFGPGYGESILLHVGSGHWIIIDSCLDNDGTPAAISYLKEIGVSPAAVRVVAATHWHDDHIKGLPETLRACGNARFCIGAALTRKEFLAFLIDHDERPVTKLDRGGTQLLECLRIMKGRSDSIKPLSEDTIILDFDEDDLDHKLKVELRALSPSGAQFSNFLTRIASIVAQQEGAPKTRIVDPGRNDLSVAMLLVIGGQAILLGADLEQILDASMGWKAVVGARKGRKPLAHIFKVPHHGSDGAHNDDVWEHLLEREPVSIITPWRRGGRFLPKESEILKVKELSSQVFVTSTRDKGFKNNYTRDVLKAIKTSESSFSSAIKAGGRVTLRWRPPVSEVDVQLFNGAARM